MIFSRLLAWAAVLAAGAVTGALGPQLEDSPITFFHVMALVLADGWAWIALGFVIGLAHTRTAQAAVAGPVALITAVCAYYTVQAAHGAFSEAVSLESSSAGTRTDWNGFAATTLLWCLVAAIAGVLAALAGNQARQSGLPGLLLRLAVPAMAIVETSLRLDHEAHAAGHAAEMTWTVTRLAAAAAVVIIGLAWIRHRNSKNANPHPTLTP
ncbi:hypothetical protein GCM10010252_19700 [Streptomyces aureoverticillatus]|nr:hypothetical protein GCM10010252_19700 [Streptomyces aureoverticillatus]